MDEERISRRKQRPHEDVRTPDVYWRQPLHRAPTLGQIPESGPSADEQVASFLLRVFSSIDSNAAQRDVRSALVPWVCDVLASEHSVKGYGRDLAHFFHHMNGLGVQPLEVTGDHLKLDKAALLKAGMEPATIARRLSVLRGAYQQFAIKGLVPWTVSLDIAAVKGPPLTKNTTPALTSKQAIAMLQAIPTNTPQGIRDLAMLQTFFITGCRVSAITGACVGHLEFDGVEHYLNVTEKRNKKARKVLLDAARPLLAYIDRAGIRMDAVGPLFRPIRRDGTGFECRHLNRKTPWRLVKRYCRAAGIDPDRLGRRGIGIHPLRKTAINDAIRNGAQMHEVRQFAGHSDIRTTEGYFVRCEEDAEQAARRI
jgi:integrase/recombinase XerD